MPGNDAQHPLIHLIGELQEEEALEQVRRLVDTGVDPLLVFDICHKGMIRVGEYYEKGRYAISGLIMAGEIMRQVGQVLFPLIENQNRHADTGKLVLGTVEGDIHYIGKDIFKTLVRGHGFTVHDLGVDVAPANFLSAIHEFKPDIVGISCLISGAYRSFKETIAFLRQNVPAALAPRAYIGGGRLDQLMAAEIGLDHWTSDAAQGVRLCRKIMADSRPR